MWIVAIAWIYVVVLMAATEPTAVGGVMTFLFYCALPLSILFYITGARRRRLRRQTAQRPGDRKAGNAPGREWDGDGAADGDGD
ncbi:hypothetical protein AB2N08_00155 [Massilia aurea]|uniref:hypothetical protein n=1 Tax=Massilia aurea TaxID=373040 RepID=UPI0034633A73